MEGETSTLAGRGRRSDCCARIASLLCSSLGVCLLVILYTALGALLFTSLEGHSPPQHRSASPRPSDGTLGLHQDTGNVDEGANSGFSAGGHSGTDGGAGVEEPQQDDKMVAAEVGTGSAAAAAVVFAGDVFTQQLRHQTVERLWSITESLNILYRENWTRVVENELRLYSHHLLTNLLRERGMGAGGAGGSVPGDEAAASRARHDGGARQGYEEQWGFAGSFLYSLTVITTVGYGSVSPQTALGRAATIGYALLGIPLMLLYLSSVGDLLSRFLKWLWSKLCRCRRQRQPSELTTPRPLGMPGPYTSVDGCKMLGWGPPPEEAPVPVTLCLVLLTLYTCGGAAILAHCHGWPYLHALGFCFGALTTIGFGDLRPSSAPPGTAAEQLQLLAAALYLLVGMALIATSFNLMQEQVTARGGGNTVISRKLGGLVAAPAPHHRFHLDDT